MDGLLFLCHRIPYPPDKGDKVRSFNVLKYLADRYAVHLATFVDDPDDWRHVERLRRYCAETLVLPLSPIRSALWSLRACLTGGPLSLPYFYDRRIQAWVDRLTASGRIKVGFAYTSPMAQYLLNPASGSLRRIVDFVDVDSDKWRQYGESATGPKAWIWRREGNKLREFECRLSRLFDAGLLVSEAEVRLFRSNCPTSADSIGCYGNGVDSEYFDPELDAGNPYAGREPGPVVVFTGTMDYRPNVDAVTWFAQQVMPRIRAQAPGAKFYIVGARPCAEVTALADLERVHVTGRVDDVRPYLKYADVAVAPMRLVRGLQNKVLEAMSMALPVVVTPAVAASLFASPQPFVHSAASPDEFASHVVDCFDRRRRLDQGRMARRYVQRWFRWSDKLQMLGDQMARPDVRVAGAVKHG